MIIEDLLMTNCFVRCCKAEEVDDSGKKRKLSFSPKAGEYFLLFKIDSENGFKFLENIGMQNPHNERKNDYIGLYLQVDICLLFFLVNTYFCRLVLFLNQFLKDTLLDCNLKMGF